MITRILSTVSSCCAGKTGGAVAVVPGQWTMRRISIHWRRLLLLGEVPVCLNAFMRTAFRRSESPASATPQRGVPLVYGLRAWGGEADFAGAIFVSVTCRTAAAMPSESRNKVRYCDTAYRLSPSAGSGRTRRAHQIRAPPAPGDFPAAPETPFSGISGKYRSPKQQRVQRQLRAITSRGFYWRAGRVCAADAIL